MTAWYNYNLINNYGVYPDPEGPYPKPDINVLVPSGVQITALLAGTVTTVNSVESWGPTVTVQLAVPLNSLATHIAYLHLGKAQASVGQKVVPGTVIGVAGNSNSGAAIGLALCNGPHYGSGSGFSHVGSVELNPTALLNAVRSGKTIVPAPSGGSGGSSNPTTGILATTFSNFSQVASDTHQIVNNVPGFTGIIEAIDNAEKFQAFKIISQNVDVGIIGNLPWVGKGVQDSANAVALPAETIQASLVFITSNAMAFFIRAFLVIIGMIIIISLVQNAYTTFTIYTTGSPPTKNSSGSSGNSGAAVQAAMLLAE